MAMPRSVTKVNKNGFKFISNVDRAQYTIEELTRAALRDCAKLIRRRLIDEQKKFPGMRRNKRIYRSTQYWVRKRETDLQIGFKHDSWYGAHSELGQRNQPARNLLRKTVYQNIDQMRLIQGKYLKAVENENVAKGLISFTDYKSPEGSE